MGVKGVLPVVATPQVLFFSLKQNFRKDLYRMVNKDMDKHYYSIGEFSKIVGLSVATLRYYDKEGIFSPAKHSGGERNKRSLYAPVQIIAFKMVRVMRDLGIPLHTIKDAVRNRTPESLLKLLSKQRYEVLDKLHLLQESLSVANTFIELLICGLSATETEITVSELPEIRIILGGCNDFSGAEGFYREFNSFCHAKHAQPLNLSYPIGGFFESMTDFLNAPSQPSRFFSIDPKGAERREAGLYLVGYSRGYYGDTGDLPKRLSEYADKNGLTLAGPVYNMFLFDEVSIADPNKYLLQAAASLGERHHAPKHINRNHF